MGPVVSTRLVTSYGAKAGSLWTTLSTVQVSSSVVSISLHILRSMWMVSNLTLSKLSPLGYKQLTPISSMP